jgi:hypothetical protein
MNYHNTVAAPKHVHEPINKWINELISIFHFDKKNISEKINLFLQIYLSFEEKNSDFFLTFMKIIELVS